MPCPGTESARRRQRGGIVAAEWLSVRRNREGSRRKEARRLCAGKVPTYALVACSRPPTLAGSEVPCRLRRHTQSSYSGAPSPSSPRPLPTLTLRPLWSVGALAERPVSNARSSRSPPMDRAFAMLRQTPGPASHDGASSPVASFAQTPCLAYTAIAREILASVQPQDETRSTRFCAPRATGWWT